MRSAVAPQTLARGSREVPASAVATPILEWTSARELTGSVLAVGRDVAYLGFRGGVMALTARGVPLMPNGVAVGVDSRREGHGAFCGVLQTTDRARLHAEGIDVGGLHVRWPWPAPAWEPRVTGGPWPRDRVLARGESIMRHLRIDVGASPDALAASMASNGIAVACDERGARAIVALFRSLRRRSPEDVREAAVALLGLGPGLTPEGDDLLAAAVVTVVALGPSAGLHGRMRRRLVEALAPDPAGRTTALSATLLELAAVGRPLEPVRGLLDPDDDRRCETAIERLLKVGHTTGRVYVTGVGATALALAHR